MTEVQYHRDGYGPARPAINVKVYAAGLDFWPATLDNCVDRVDRYVGEAYDRVQERFWEDAATRAEESGLGPIEQEGRSGGWLVLTDGRDPQEDATWAGDNRQEDVCDRCDEPYPAHVGTAERCPDMADWLTAYAELRDWCEDYVAAAPRKVRALAQSLAMDAIGEGAALRMFATYPGFPRIYMASVARGEAIMAGYEEGGPA